MRMLAALPLLALAVACVDTTPVGPDDAGLTVAASASRVASTFYAFHGSRDYLCGPAEGCSSGTSFATPSGVLHGKGVTGRIILTGGLTGELWVSYDYMVNLRNGKVAANGGTVLLDLTAPGTGTFECTGHGTIEGYMPPLFAFVEHVTYLGCRGTGDFAGMHTIVRMTNEADPGIGEYEGVAEIW